MTSEFGYLRSKRYWALLLLWPPLKVLSAYAVFAGLHVGLGIPWPTLEDSGLFFSMLEMIGFLGLFLLLDGVAVGIVYRLNVFRRDRPNEKQPYDPVGAGFAATATLGGFALVLVLPFASLQAGFDHGPATWIIFLFSMVSGFHFPTLARQAEWDAHNADARQIDDEAAA